MAADHIYKVKYARLKTIDTLKRMPYDLWYVIPVRLIPQMNRMFPYWWEIECDAALVDVMKTYQQDDKAIVPANQRKHAEATSGTLRDGIPWDSLGDVVLGIPTYSKSMAERSELAYVWSRHLPHMRVLQDTMKDTLDNVRLHMPGTVVPGRCTRCARVLNYHRGECTPGDQECLRTQKIYTPTQETVDNADDDLVS